MSEAGRIFRVRTWDDHGRNYRIGYGLRRNKRDKVALMLCLGEFPKGEPLPDGEIDQRLLELGFKRIEPLKEASTDG